VWTVETTEDFAGWFAALGAAEQAEVIAKVNLLKVMGPMLKRPHADTLNGSRYANMKELRARTPGAEIRVAFAFDPLQKAILLIGGNKSGVSEKRFYQRLIDKADRLYATHLVAAAAKKIERDKKGKDK
jgi:hypothetical protein